MYTFAGQVLQTGKDGKMTLRWIGAALIVAGTGSVGFKMVNGVQKESSLLRELIQSLDLMCWELECRRPPLHQLCCAASRDEHGGVARVLRELSSELERRIAPDAGSCMAATLKKIKDLPPSVRELFTELGTSLGRFDLEGQLEGLEAVKRSAQRKLTTLEEGKKERLRSYQTLGICAGIALAILFL
jgi:stage III sporulation protein AB